MTQWKGKSRGTPLGYRVFIFTIKTFGLRPAYFLLRFVAGYYFLFSWKTSHRIYSYLRKRQGYGVSRALLGVYKNYYVFGQTLIDKIVVMSGIKNPFTFSFDGEENLRQIAQNQTGGILLSAHVGNWEAAGHLLERLNSRINVVMYDAEHQRIKQTLDDSTGGKNFQIIPIVDDMSHVFAIHEALARKELVCFHADRFLPDSRTSSRFFLGAPALFPVGVFALATGMKVPVSIVFAFKETSKHYHFYGSKSLERNDTETKAEFAERLTVTFISELEEKIKKYPLQWFNYYDFWEK